MLTPVPISGDADAPNVVGDARCRCARSTFSEPGARRRSRPASSTAATRPVDRRHVTLEIDGRAVQTQPLDVEADGSASVTFDPVTVAGRNMRGTVRARRRRAGARQRVSFVVSPAEPVRVDRRRSRRRAERERSTCRARSRSATRRASRSTTRQPDALSRRRPARSASVVVLNDVAGAAGARPSGWRGSSSAAAACSSPLGPRATWPQDVGHAAGGCSGSPSIARAATRRALGALEYGHPVFEPFRAPRSGDFSVGAVLRLSRA